MHTSKLGRTLVQLLDKSVLYTLHRQVSDSLAESTGTAPTLETVLAQTRVDTERTAVYTLSAPGEHPVWLQTAGGPLRCHVSVRPARDPRAPLLLYHHGINEWPYTSSWRRIFRHRGRFRVHNVCIQAPFHDSWGTPISDGFASIGNLYQMFAGSLRLMELVQTQFEAAGAAYTVLAGVSWGGMTGLLYESLFRRARAVIPMLAAPNLAQVILDIAQMFGREVPVSRDTVAAHLDFTPYYRRLPARDVYPLLGENDLFFRLENHAAVYDEAGLVTIDAGHITGLWQPQPLRRHVAGVLHHLAGAPTS